MSDTEAPSTNPWAPANYRDEDARLLVRAMVQHRDALRAQHPWVPVQGYAVRDDSEHVSGALTVGALVTLWENALDLMYGKCPSCPEGHVWGFSISGGDTMWILAPCWLCGFISQRKLPAQELYERLAAAFDGTPYPVPTQWKLNSMCGLPHAALIATLRSLGARLLPAEHYGFIGASSGGMRYSANPIIGQACLWAYRAIRRHAPTRAQLEETEATWTIARDLALKELERTGRLPELDYAMPDNLVITFPLISQEEVRPAGIEEEEEERDPHEVAQAAMDRLVASWKAGKVDAAALAKVIEWFDEIDSSDGIDRDGATLWLSASSIQSAYESDESEVREHMKLEEWCPVSHEARIHYLVEHALPLLFDDADVTHLMVPVPVVASNGDSLWLTVAIQGYSFTIIQKEWSGPFDSVEEFTASLRETGWVASVEEFEALPDNRQREIVMG